MEISFENVVVKTKAGKELLSHVTGVARPGTLTSLMGSSGSGKTTLLSTLSRRFEASLFYSGNIRYGGRKFTQRDRRAIAFVQQDDIMPTYLTVEDFLTYSAKLRLDVSDEVRTERVEKVIARLRLQKCRKTVIGGVEARGVSGGERKRTNIANELLTEPQVVFTDEPTSGLDSTLSNVVIEILKELAKDGLTVVTTIHSPSSWIFDQFDALIVLDEGKVFYRGKAKNLVGFLTDTLGRNVPAMFNPADYLMDVLVLEKDSPRDEKTLKAMASFEILDVPSATSSESADGSVEVNDKTGAAIEPQQMPSTHARHTMSYRGKQMLRSVSVIFRPGDEDEMEHEKKYARSFFAQAWILTSRLWKLKRRDVFTKNQIMSTLGLSLINGLLFFQLGFTEVAIFSRVALALWLTGIDMYLSTFSTAFALLDDMPLVKKELYDGSYSLGAHVLAKQLVMYPSNGFWSVIFCAIVLASSRLAPSAGHAVLALLTVQSEVFLFQGVGFLLSATAAPSGLLTVAVLLVSYFWAFNGFFTPFALMAEWYRWLRWPCLLTYPFQLIMHIVFSDPNTIYSCNEAPLNSAYPSCTNGSGVITGEDILRQFDIDMSTTTCALVIVIAGFIIRFLAFLAYRVRMTPPKGINDQRRGCCGRKKKSKTDADLFEKEVPAENQQTNDVQVV